MAPTGPGSCRSTAGLRACRDGNGFAHPGCIVAAAAAAAGKPAEAWEPRKQLWQSWVPDLHATLRGQDEVGDRHAGLGAEHRSCQGQENFDRATAQHNLAAARHNLAAARHDLAVARHNLAAARHNQNGLCVTSRPSRCSATCWQCGAGMLVPSTRCPSTPPVSHLAHSLASAGANCNEHHGRCGGRASRESYPPATPPCLERPVLRIFHLQQDKTLAAQRRAVGPEHPDRPNTLTADGLVWCMCSLGKTAETESVYRALLEVRRRMGINGPEYSDAETVQCRSPTTWRRR